MTDAKTIAELNDQDLDQVQGGGIAVGNPGEKKDLLGDGQGPELDTASSNGWSRVRNDKSYDVGD